MTVAIGWNKTVDAATAEAKLERLREKKNEVIIQFTIISVHVRDHLQPGLYVVLHS